MNITKFEIFFLCYLKLITMLNYYKIKVWSDEEQIWYPTYYYIVQPQLPRTMGYMYQSVVNKLPTKKEILYKIFRSKL